MDERENFNGIASLPPQFVAEYERLKPLYNGALKTVCSRFEILDDEFSILQGHDPIHSIERRLKTVQSAYEKLPRRDYDQSPENISKLTDIAGVRVVCTYTAFGIAPAMLVYFYLFHNFQAPLGAGVHTVGALFGRGNRPFRGVAFGALQSGG